MRTRKLNKILTSHPHSQCYYLGTFAADTIPKKPTSLTCFVSNTDPQSQPGQHWVAFCVNQKGYTYYFDSYGIPPINLRHLRFCRNSSQGFWTFNRQQLQNLTSSNCGYHCVRFIIETCQPESSHCSVSHEISSDQLDGQDRCHLHADKRKKMQTEMSICRYHKHRHVHFQEARSSESEEKTLVKKHAIKTNE